MTIKKGVMIICFSLLIFTMFSFASAESSCNDTDGDKSDPDNFLIKGTCTDSTGSYTDECGSDPLSASDWYCTSSGNCAKKGISCTYFFGKDYVCEDGACVKFVPESEPLPPTPSISCTDSDGGMNFYVKGEVIFSNAPDIKYIDYCKYDRQEGIWYLYENWCGEYHTKVEIYACENECKDGACVRTPVECSDSDGMDIYNKGTVKSEGQTFVDSCGMFNGREVVAEAVCEETGGKIIEFFCWYGCKNGACIEPKLEEPSEEEPEAPEMVEEESLLTEDCWDLNKNGIMDSAEDKNFNDKVDVFDCTVGEKKEEIKVRFNEYINESAETVSFLINEANITLIIKSSDNTSLIYGFEISRGMIKNFEMIEPERPHYIVIIDEESAKEIFILENPKSRIVNLYLNDKIIIQPQTFWAKVKYFFVDKLNIVGRVISKLA